MREPGDRRNGGVRIEADRYAFARHRSRTPSTATRPDVVVADPQHDLLFMARDLPTSDTMAEMSPEPTVMLLGGRTPSTQRTFAGLSRDRTELELYLRRRMTGTPAFAVGTRPLCPQ